MPLKTIALSFFMMLLPPRINLVAERAFSQMNKLRQAVRNYASSMSNHLVSSLQH
jgi:hypothetical protein